MSNDFTYNLLSEKISQADSQGIFLSRDELDRYTKYFKDGVNRIEILKRLSDNASIIVAKAANELFAEQAQLIASGDNAYPKQRYDACLRDLEIILRYVSYAMLAGNNSVLDERLLNALSEIYQALGIATASVALGINKMKGAAISFANAPNGDTQGDHSHLISELAEYFDYVTAVVDGRNLELVYIPYRTDKRAVTTQEIERETTVKNQVDISFNCIDQKSISFWISEEVAEEEFILTVGTTYTLNIKVVESEGANMPGSSLTESLPKQGFDTEWVVSSSSIELKEMTTGIFITSTAIGLKTIWSANFLLSIPIFGDSRILQLQITPRSAENTSLSFLVYAYGSLYRQFDIQLDVLNNSKNLSTVIAC